MEEVAREEVEVDKDVEKKIKKTVKKILQRSSFYKMTENKAREQASSELDLDLSQDPYKLIVKEAVESYIEQVLKVVGNNIVKLQTYNSVDEETTMPKSKKIKKKNKESSTWVFFFSTIVSVFELWF